MRTFVSRVFALCAFNVVLGLIIAQIVGCAGFKQAAPLIAEGQVMCADAGLSAYSGVASAIHDGGKNFETIVSAVMNGLADIACVEHYVRQHWAEHQCADAGSSQCAVAAMPVDEQRRAEILLRVVSGMKAKAQ